MKLRISNLSSLFCSLLFVFSANATAKGVSLDATRIVYVQGEKSVAISVVNSEAKTTYLTRAFITTENNDRNTPFEVTPPVFKVAPNSQQEVRILAKNNTLPTDRESLFLFHAMMIAGQSEKVDGDGLNIGYDHVIKLFYRPKNLPLTSDDAQKKLKFTVKGSQLIATNDTPYYINLAQVKINQQRLDVSLEKKNTTIPPFSSLSYPISPGMNKGAIIWRTITDLGGTHEFNAQLP